MLLCLSGSLDTRWLFCPGGVGGGLSCELFAFPVEPLRSVTDARPVAVVRPCCPATFFVVSSIGDLCLVLEFLFSRFLALWRCFVSLSGWVVSVSVVSFKLSGRFVLWSYSFVMLLPSPASHVVVVCPPAEFPTLPGSFPFLSPVGLSWNNRSGCSAMVTQAFCCSILK